MSDANPTVSIDQYVAQQLANEIGQLKLSMSILNANLIAVTQERDALRMQLDDALAQIRTMNEAAKVAVEG